MCSSKVVRLSRTFLYNTSPYYVVCLVGFFHNDHWLEALFLKTSLLYCTESQNVTTWLSCRSSQYLQVLHCFQFCYILVTLWIFAKYEMLYCTLHILLDYSISAFVVLLVNKAKEWLYSSVFNFQNPFYMPFILLFLE